VTNEIEQMKFYKEGFDGLELAQQLMLLIRYSNKSKDYLKTLTQRERSRLFCVLFCQAGVKGRIIDSIELLLGTKHVDYIRR
jgi:hypothetical protein